MTAQAAPFTNDQVDNAEHLRDIITAVYGKVVAHSREVETADPEEARRLMEQLPKLRSIWQRGPIRDDAWMAEQIAHWGGVLKAFNAGQEAPLWEAVNRL